MKKFIALLIILASGAAAALYFKNDISMALVTNDYQMVAKQFWINTKDDIDSGISTNLPLKSNVKEIDFSLGEATLLDGKYYFETTLYVNRAAALPIYTVVEPNLGQWRVNATETFLTITSASLNKFTNDYSKALISADTFIEAEALHGLTGLATQAQVQDVESLIDEQFSQAKQRFKDQYLASVGLTVSDSK